ncbi:glycosyltransferase family 4 protein [Shewanella salipaludis]|uniref:Glycosyltransferase family 4 protein n=1 Tax=Shewanella salipaludis TaxID=2723052 RepID=A0A972FTB9_9GAMM|nr:glycosyltransferase family 4 protein [Shewanella salipaludis]NMH65366.1 glycosyltransferase family 4 protein [Shewanella salipaludis]
MKTKVLFLMQLPPPVHGASMMNLFIKSSSLINEQFNCEFIDISPENTASGLGKFSFEKVFKSFKIVCEASKAYFKFKPKLVYVAISPHGLAFYKDALSISVLKLMGAKFVYHLHGKGIESESRTFIKKIIYRLVFKGADVIHLSECLHSDIRDVRDTDCDIYTLANGVPDHYDVHANVSRLPTFLYLSNFIPSKGAHVFLEAINKLDDKYRGCFKVLLVGSFRDDDYKEKLKLSIAEKFPESIELVGPAYGDDKVEFLNNSDVFVLPTSYKNECFPLSILEGMCHSLAVVSTYEGAIPNIIDDDKNGKLFNVENIDVLCEIIRNYIDDKDLLLEHKSAAREKFLSDYEISVFESNLCKILNTITQKKQEQIFS